MSSTKIVTQNNQYSPNKQKLGSQVSHLTPQNQLQYFQEGQNDSIHKEHWGGLPSQISNKSGLNAATASTFQQKSMLSSRKHPQELKKHNSYQLEGLDDSVFPNHQVNQQNQSNLMVKQTEPRQRKKSTSYEQKVDQFHLAEAKGIKPNIFNQQSNSSPVHQPNQNFAIKPIKQEEQYIPYNEHSRNKKLKNNESRYSSKKITQQVIQPSEQDMIVQVPRSKSKRLPSINQSNNNPMLSSYESSTIILSKPKADRPHNNIDPFSDQGVERQFGHILQPITLKTTFRFVRSQQFGVNFIHPDYKILGQDSSILISGKKQSFHLNSYYNLTTINHGEECILGTLRGNFGGTQFNVYRSREHGQELIATIYYDSSCGNDYRKMQVYVKKSSNNDPVFHSETVRKNLMELYQEGYETHIQRHVTKQPTWSESSQSYIMSFGGKAKLPSIKNMILMPEKSQHVRSLLFCKSSRDVFNLEIYKSFSLLVTMGILLSSFDFKLLCQ